MVQGKGKTMFGISEGHIDYKKKVSFPLVRDELKKTNKALSDSIWEDDISHIDIYRNKVKMLEALLDLGEEYVIPF